MPRRLVLAVIPARSGSKSIPNKNLLKVHGLSLTKYALFSAQHNKFITHIALTSDSDKILSEIDSFEGSRFIRIKRPIELSSDESPDQPVLEHALKFSEKLFNIKFEAVLMLQPTSPIRSQNDLNRCINNVLSSKAETSWTVSEVPIRFHYKKQFEIYDQSLVIATNHGHVPRRQDLKNTYHRDGACYAYTRQVVIDDSMLMGTRCLPVISEVLTHDIDYFEDFSNLEYLTYKEDNQLYWK